MLEHSLSEQQFARQHPDALSTQVDVSGCRIRHPCPRRQLHMHQLRLLANPDIGVTQIAQRLGVSPATLYIPATRTANTPGV
jgi:hypothetical protein